ncbi:rhodanese-like domain-containing protein [Cytophaga aurantiaca]|uniref:rhodanese-like domain-containing protein n=1 Tax=Cytophaga aurantiaca TaxID=29530 RepID=UPI000374122A|nr:rhodanese-like domain-containing protein [Cytophaga aurantiaca]
MIGFLKNLFGSGTPIDYSTLVKNGATIIDVRTKGEYQGGHIKGSLNIPLDTLKSNLSKLKKENPIITCCASGMRSSSARSILKANGFVEVYNGGGWSGLQSKIK